jgi:LmbE family N-acetylglucosaminyl deacetylase
LAKAADRYRSERSAAGWLMRSLTLARSGAKLSVLCVGAHADDIEIGAGGTLLTWILAGTRIDVHWCVLSAAGQRAREARASAAAFLSGAASAKVEFADFRDSFFPYQGDAIKEWLADLRKRTAPDVIFSHQRSDGHQDHKELANLIWNTFRDHLILEYEVPKWDGDLREANVYVPLTENAINRKIELLLEYFASQRSKDWFEPEVFRGLARLRGMECRAPERYAEAFVLRKAVVSCDDALTDPDHESPSKV